MNRLSQPVERVIAFSQDLLLRPRKIGSIAASAALLGVGANQASLLRPSEGEASTTASGLLNTGGPKLAKPFNIQGAYPNFSMAHNDYLDGTNDLQPNYDPSDPNSSDVADLTFQDMGNGIFRQGTMDPADPHNVLNYDVLQWQPGAKGVLVYKETKVGYGDSNHPLYDEVFSPGIKFMPKTWKTGQKWDINSSTNELRKEIDPASGKFVPVCIGSVAYHAWVMGSIRLPSGAIGVEEHIDEHQTLTAVPGAPPSRSCPGDLPAKSPWEEDYTEASIPVEDSNGVVIGQKLALWRSQGGYTPHFKIKFKDWGDIYHTVLNSWRPKPQVNTNQTQGK